MDALDGGETRDSNGAEGLQVNENPNLPWKFRRLVNAPAHSSHIELLRARAALPHA